METAIKRVIMVHKELNMVFDMLANVNFNSYLNFGCGGGVLNVRSTRWIAAFSLSLILL